MENNIFDIIKRHRECNIEKLQKQTKIKSINEIFDGKKLLITDFSNLDLSNIDLSIIPPDLWQNCIFFNTNFANTGIKFIPNKLKCTNFNSYVPISINYCDFSGNDLSYLTKEDFKINRREIETVGCNFRNTSLKHDTLMYLYDVVLDDIKNQNLYVILNNNEIVGVFAFIIGADPSYSYIEGKWLNDELYGTIHRIASNFKIKGILETAVDYCFTKVSNLRIDTHEVNIPMQSAISKLGFTKCGIIYLVSDNTPRIAYQKVR